MLYHTEWLNYISQKIIFYPSVRRFRARFDIDQQLNSVLASEIRRNGNYGAMI
ncbi:hypothetical protein NZD89_18385 [Alicyclobacillus fastidiosus]|uniref:Uncharacterized protein n=1 Tax=Alicyclobacillus fastidiosus TaxID=392011 RepID=A0ABY6ZDX0_9BACL|nr:hypothetical protein [Alicyclobacillus fastidiosus]WAH40325.1 hypothetical protein NZD89_18385 [Alicyclobacillus fastidiosus]GMA61708.1 hypothetical protein GCM10025859_21480 [Alicyclobacillus fastidiosus]